MDIRQIIKNQMTLQGMTQLRLVQLTGICQPRISVYLTGKQDMTGENLRKILEALDLEIRPAPRRRKGT